MKKFLEKNKIYPKVGLILVSAFWGITGGIAINSLFQLYDSIFIKNVDSFNIWMKFLFLITLLVINVTLFHKAIKLSSNLSKTKIKINSYVTSSIILIIFILIVGIVFLRNFFPSDLPFSITSQKGFEIKCDSYRGLYNSYIINLNNFCIGFVQETINITKIEIVYPFTNKPIESREIKINDKGEFKFNFAALSVEDQLISLNFFNGAERIDSFDIPTTKIYANREEYSKNEFEKLTYFVALISLSIFSVLSAVNNFKQIVEGKK